MSPTLITIAVFAILFAPFAVLILLLYARSRRRIDPGAPRKSYPWDGLPLATQHWALAAIFVATMGLGSHAQRIYANVWIDRIIWVLAPLFLGVALGHWQADRMAKTEANRV
jgi:hypothetical protein